ncbi:hypothetical protein VB002_10270 [Campylobacter concisus]
MQSPKSISRYFVRDLAAFKFNNTLNGISSRLSENTSTKFLQI